MKKYHQLVPAALAVFTMLAGSLARADNMASIGITPATGVVTLAPHWSIGGGLAGFHQMSQDLGLGGQANNFYSIISAEIPMGGNVAAFNLYVAASGFATSHADIGSKLTPYSYSALTSADPDVGYGAVNMYFIHHKSTGDYFSVLVPGSAVSSAVTDLKPMDGPGGPATLGTGGYFGLTFSAANLGYGLNQFYYLRTDPVTGDTIFGTLDPALLHTSADQFSLRMNGHAALAFTGVDVGYGTDKMYYLRQDPVTGFTILGMLNPALAGVRHTSDIANLGSVFTTLTFTASDLGFGVNHFYTTGSINPTWQSVSFAAIADRMVSAGSFTVKPTASSGLPIVLTLVTGSATISAPVGGVFTVTPTARGLITLQATQVGAINPVAYEYNMLRQSFTVTGVTGSSPDFDHNGTPDIIWQNIVTGGRALWLMNGTTVASAVSLGTDPDVNWRIVGAADFDGNGSPDIIWQNIVTGGRALWLMNGTTFSSAISLGTDPDVNWRIVGTADFDGNGTPDIIWQNIVTGGRALWLMNGTTFSSAVSLGTDPDVNWRIAGAADFDGNGSPDIIWQNIVTGGRALWLMNGTTFSRAISLGSDPDVNWRIAGAADFDGNGSPDIIWQNIATGGRALWLMNGTAFSSAVSLGTDADVNWRIAN